MNKPLDPVNFLLVDDLPENLLSLEALLRRDGLQLLKARTGQEALELLLQHEVALALLDVQMPGMDGFELAEAMRSTERTRRVPIIFLTAGTADWQRRFRGYETGAVDFLQKPIESHMLQSKAQVFFDLHRQQQLLARQRDELMAATSALQEADKRKDEFIATLAHELRNPLAPVRNGLTLLRMTEDHKIAANVRDMMDRQLTHLVRLIDDLLDVSRVSQGKIDLRRHLITVQTVLEASVEAARPLIEESGHTFTCELPTEPLWLDADLTRLAQIVSNLLNNAAKYTPRGGRVHLAARREDGSVVITVSDNGMGIPPAMLSKVFELFAQVNPHQEQAQGGLGIGLALVRKLVEMHGGNIVAESAGRGQGSRFVVRLPLAGAPADAAAPAAATVAATATPVNGLRVLVVDDNVASAKTMGWTLEMLGHQPTLAHSGPEALEQARILHPQVILLDIGLPGMSGYEVCRALRIDPAFKDTMLIAQTGWGQERDKREAKEAGFDHHLVKPVRFEQFAELLATIKASA